MKLRTGVPEPTPATEPPAPAPAKETPAPAPETPAPTPAPETPAPAPEVAAPAPEAPAPAAAEAPVQAEEPAPLPEVPAHVPYLLVGGGTASFAAFRAIKARDAKAKVGYFIWSRIVFTLFDMCLLPTFMVKLMITWSSFQRIINSIHFIHLCAIYIFASLVGYAMISE